jgi:hypothetical protein
VAKDLEKLFRYEVLKMLKVEGKINDAVIENMIEDDALIKKILTHLGLWEIRIHDPPRSDDTHFPAVDTELTYDDTYSQLPPIDYWTQ